MNDNIVIGVLVCLWIVGFVGPILAGLLSHVMYFVTRGDVDVELFKGIQKKLWNWMLDIQSFDDTDLGMSWFCFNGVVLAGIYCFIGVLIINVPYIVSISLLGLCCTPLVLRFILDLCKSLKYNYKSGKAERIDALEAEIEKLKAK